MPLRKGGRVDGYGLGYRSTGRSSKANDHDYGVNHGENGRAASGHDVNDHDGNDQLHDHDPYASGLHVHVRRDHDRHESGHDVRDRKLSSQRC